MFNLIYVQLILYMSNSAEWGGHSRVQVIQQPLPNNAYLQQLYNAQGPLLMPGNIALHPGINSQQIQVRKLLLIYQLLFVTSSAFIVLVSGYTITRML